MDTVGSVEAKTNFSALLARVERGEQITSTRRGKPVARLVPIRPREKTSLAAYLERAIRIDGTLSTLDRALMRAARHLGVATAP